MRLRLLLNFRNVTKLKLQKICFIVYSIKIAVNTRVVDPDNFNSDPDPAFTSIFIRIWNQEKKEKKKN
jgi:hypothetical protein